MVQAIEEGDHDVTALSSPIPPPEWSQSRFGPLTIHTYALGIIAATVITQQGDIDHRHRPVRVDVTSVPGL